MKFAERLLALWTRQDGRAVSERSPDPSRVVVRMMSTAGVSITPDTAMRTAVVWACVTYLSRTVAQLPWRVMLERANGAEERASSHPVDYLLNRRPNAEMGAFSWRETMVGWAARWGNAIAEIQRDARGVPVALWPIHPERVDIARDDDTGDLVYEISGDRKATLSARDVFHLRGFGEGPVGLNVVAYAAESIGWVQATELFGAAFFGNGINPSVSVEFPHKLSAEAKDVIREELADLYAGPRKAHRAFIGDNGMKLQKLSVEPDSAQFVETRQHQVEEICRWFGVPPHKVMHLLRSTFSNIEHQSIEVVVDSIVPWAKRLEEEADYKLFGSRARHFTKIDMKGLMRGDFKSRQEGLQIMRRNGVINGNEWRRLEDMNEIGAQGDKYIVEGNMTTLERVGEEPVQSVASAPADPSAVDRARLQVAAVNGRTVG